jgi:YidC/Oxa1 family membrane protein insertase
MWDIFINPAITALVLLYQVFGNNIALAIAALTVILRLVMYPIFVGQQEQSQKMSALQPEIDAMKEKYKDDKEKQLQAQQELWKREGINPLGGCFPMLLQLPLFIALYSAINLALAATPFELVDLSNRLLLPGLQGLVPLQNTFLGMNLTLPPTPPSNPIYAYALPALVALTTYFQFKMSTGTRPKPADNKASNSQPDQAAQMQQSMAMTMPIMYGFISLSFSAGLSLYFLIGNLVGIVQYIPAVKKVLDTIFLRNKTAPVVTVVEPADKPSKPTKKSVGKTN